MKPSLLLTLFSISFVQLIFAQQSTLRQQQLEVRAYEEKQQIFHDWMHQRQGPINKQYLRASWMLQNHWHPHESIGAVSDIYQDYAQKKKSYRRTSAESWIPVGPYGVKSSPQPYENRGNGRVNVVRFHPTNPDVLWIGTANGGIWKSINAGKSWMPIGDDLPVLRVSDIAINPENPDEMYVCLGDIYTVFVDVNNFYPSSFGEGIYKSTDGGATWNPTALRFGPEQDQLSLLKRIMIHPENPTQLLAAGISGLWISEDGGDSWEQTLSDEIILDLESNPQHPNTVYATSTITSSKVLRSYDFGRTWHAYEMDLPQNGDIIRMEVAVAPSDTNQLYVLAAANTGGLHSFYRSADAGVSWTKTIDSQTGPNILAQLNGDPELLETEAYGQGEYDLALAVNPFDANIVYTGGINVWGSADGGAKWDVISFVQQWFGPTIHQDIHSINYNPLDGKYYVCNDGGLDRTDSLEIANVNFALFNCLNFDDLTPKADCYQLPTQWESLSEGLAITEFYALSLHPDVSDQVVAGCQDNSVFYKKENGFINVFDGDGMQPIIDPSDTNHIFAMMELGRLEVSRNGGTTVEDLATEAIFQDPTQFPAWKSPMVYDNDSACLYVGFSDLWRSKDRAKTWEKVSDLPIINGSAKGLPIRSIAINENQIYLSRQNFFLENNQAIPSELWKSEDYGQSWSQISGLPNDITINDIAIHPDNNQEVWVVYAHLKEGQKVYRTKDGGAVWENMTFNLPNLPVHTIELLANEQQSVFIGMDRGIWTIAADSETWENYGSGLPNVIINDLEFDARTNELYAATFGRGIWKAAIEAVVHSNIEEVSEGALHIYPNPSSGICRIDLSQLGNFEKAELNVIDVQGRNVHSQTLKPHIVDLDFSFLDAGLYYMQVVTDGFARTVKWIKAF